MLRIPSRQSYLVLPLSVQTRVVSRALHMLSHIVLCLEPVLDLLRLFLHDSPVDVGQRNELFNASPRMYAFFCYFHYAICLIIALDAYMSRNAVDLHLDLSVVQSL